MSYTETRNDKLRAAHDKLQDGVAEIVSGEERTRMLKIASKFHRYSLLPSSWGTAVPGTYGSIFDTVRHLLGSDSWYLFDLTRDPARRIEEGRMDLGQLHDAMEADGPAWSALLAGDPDPDAVVNEVDENDGYERDAPIGIRLSQALHHGSDHRSQICSAITVLGVEPPHIDVWNFGLHEGSVAEVLPSS